MEKLWIAVLIIALVLVVTLVVAVGNWFSAVVINRIKLYREINAESSKGIWKPLPSKKNKLDPRWLIIHTDKT